MFALTITMQWYLLNRNYEVILNINRFCLQFYSFSIEKKAKFVIGQENWLNFVLTSITNRCHLSQASFVHIGQSSLVASICMSLESRTNRSTNALQSNRCHRSRHNEHFYCRHCQCTVLEPDRQTHQMRTMHQHVFANIVDRLGNPVRVVQLSMLSLSSDNRPCSDKRFRRQAYWPNAVTTNNRRPSSDSGIVSNGSLQRFVWNNLRMGFGRHIATILDSFSQKLVLRIQLWPDMVLVDHRIVEQCLALHDVQPHAMMALQHHPESHDTVCRRHRRHRRISVVCVALLPLVR